MKQQNIARRDFVRTASLATISATISGTLASVLAPCSARAVSGHGQVKPPLPVPNVRLTLHDGTTARLAQVAANHATAVQLMFTSCTTTCPIQAAIFQKVQTQLANLPAKKIQLLSLSIDPQSDTPAALNAWRKRFHAGAAWLAACASPADTEQLQDFFAKSNNSADHATQVSLLDRQSRLVWRTYELPAAQEILQLLQKI
jgi:protein SCO1/2